MGKGGAYSDVDIALSVSRIK